jgi:hypothetical protein
LHVVAEDIAEPKRWGVEWGSGWEDGEKLE